VKYLRKFILSFVSSTLVTLLIATAVLSILNNTVTNRVVVKSWFNQSGLYDNFVNEITSTTTKQSRSNPAEALISKTTIQEVANSAFKPDFIKSSLETALDGTYNWLEGKTPDLQIRLDFSNPKNVFAEQLAKRVTATATQLPVCTSANFSQPFDVFSATCIPPNVNIPVLASEFRQSILTNKDFLPISTITASDIMVDSNGTKKPISEAYQNLPTWYRRATFLVWISAFFTVLAMFGVVYLADSKRKGLWRISGALYFVASSIALTSFIGRKLAFSDTGMATNSSTGLFENLNLIVPFLRRAVIDLSTWGYKFAIGYAVVAIILTVTLLLTRKKHQQEPNIDKYTPNNPKEKSIEVEKESDTTNNPLEIKSGQK